MKTVVKTAVNFKGSLLIAIALVCGLCVSFAPKEETSNLKLVIGNVQENGILFVSFCTAKNQWTENGKYTFKFKAIKGEENVFDVPDIPKGLYAIALYQDTNANEKLDTNFFGIPKEPYAFSNNKKPGFAAPSFEKCSFNFTEQNQLVSINLLD